MKILEGMVTERVGQQVALKLAEERERNRRLRESYNPVTGSYSKQSSAI
jgi:hypothetical protein